MSKEIESSHDKVQYSRLTNKAINAKMEISKAFLNLAFVLKEIKDTGIYGLEFNNFKNYCEEKINIDWRTAYDYVKIADFIIENRNELNEESAEILGHKKLKYLTQKLSKIEDQFRKAILKKINTKDSFIVLKEKVDNILKRINSKK